MLSEIYSIICDILAVGQDWEIPFAKCPIYFILEGNSKKQKFHGLINIPYIQNICIFVQKNRYYSPHFGQKIDVILMECASQALVGAAGWIILFSIDVFWYNLSFYIYN